MLTFAFFFYTNYIRIYIYTYIVKCIFLSILAEGAEYSIVTESQAQPQSHLSALNILNTIQTTPNNQSFHSFSSGASTVEMAQYFPDTQTSNTSSSFG